MDDLQQTLNRPKQYENIDGVGELQMGFFALSFALFLWLFSRSPDTSTWNLRYGYYIYIAVVLIAINFGSKALKKYVTYPRTGYVEYRNPWKTPEGRKNLAAILGFKYGVRVVIVALLYCYLFFALKHRHSISAPISLFALLMATPYIHFARKTAWKWLIFLAMLLADLAIAILPANLLASLAHLNYQVPAVVSQLAGACFLAFVSNGMLCLLSGLITLLFYLRHTQPLGQENQ